VGTWNFIRSYFQFGRLNQADFSLRYIIIYISSTFLLFIDKRLFTELNFDFVTVPYYLWDADKGYFFEKPVSILSVLLFVLSYRRLKDILGHKVKGYVPFVIFAGLSLVFNYFELNSTLLFGLLLIPTRKHE
jgi:hypothetical protein